MNRGEFILVEKPWVFGSLRLFDILNEGDVIRTITGHGNYYHEMEVGPCVAVPHLHARMCYWNTEWRETRIIPVPHKPIRVLRGAQLPGYVCTDPTSDGFCSACPFS